MNTRLDDVLLSMVPYFSKSSQILIFFIHQLKVSLVVLVSKLSLMQAIIYLRFSSLFFFPLE